VSNDLKLGALPPVRPHGLSELAVYVHGPLPAPPPQVPAPAVVDWRMFLNDRYGDCTIAGVAHALLAWNAEVHVSDSVPVDDQVARTYFSLTGGGDSGLVEADVLRTWYREGLFGQRIAGYAPVATGSLEALHQAIAFYGAAYLGVVLPVSAQQQFAAGLPWTVAPDSPILGGHCVVAVGYDPLGIVAVTWGQLVHITYPWLAKYLTETWAILSHEFIEAGHGLMPSIDLRSLRQDLDSL
jgi:hypothetical protein